MKNICIFLLCVSGCLAGALWRQHREVERVHQRAEKAYRETAVAVSDAAALLIRQEEIHKRHINTIAMQWMEIVRRAAGEQPINKEGNTIVARTNGGEPRYAEADDKTVERENAVVVPKYQSWTYKGNGE